MGFDINFNKPVIKGAQNTQDGGAGNLGYFNNQKRKKEKDEESSVFNESEEIVDTFVGEHSMEETNDDFSFTKIIAQAIIALRDLFAKFFKQRPLF